MKTRVLRAGVACLMLAAAGAVMSSAIAHACSSTGCSSGCKVAATWCNSGVAYYFGNGVVISGSCSVSPYGGSPYNLQPNSYGVFLEFTPECSSDSPTPGTITTNIRESVGQGNYHIYCYPGS
jgi:hypothetical protein